MRRVILDGAACAEPAAAMAALEKALALPDWWGRNLDALHDCLWECGEVFLVVKNPGALRSTPFGRALWQVLADTAAENPQIREAAARRGRLRPAGGNSAGAGPSPRDGGALRDAAHLGGDPPGAGCPAH